MVSKDSTFQLICPFSFSEPSLFFRFFSSVFFGLPMLCNGSASLVLGFTRFLWLEGDKIVIIITVGMSLPTFLSVQLLLSVCCACVWWIVEPYYGCCRSGSTLTNILIQRYWVSPMVVGHVFTSGC